eukprot:1153057-Pelagomonas_calceolata.AAC.4
MPRGQRKLSLHQLRKRRHIGSGVGIEFYSPRERPFSLGWRHVLRARSPISSELSPESGAKLAGEGQRTPKQARTTFPHQLRKRTTRTEALRVPFTK